MKIQNFEISKNFRNIFEISKFWIFIDFFNDFFFAKKSKIFGPKKFSTKKFSDFFRRKNFRSKKFFGFTYSDPKFPQDSKNHT